MADSSEIRLAHLATEHNGAIDALIRGFETQLQGIVSRASARTLAELQRKLSITNGIVDRTPANQQVMRSIDLLFAREMDAAGYNGLVTSFVDRFGDQFRYFREVLDIVAPDEAVTFNSGDKAWFASQQLSAADSLNAAVNLAGGLAQQRALFSVGGIRIADLAETLSERLAKTLPEAARIADTAVTVFYRSIAERGFSKIETGLPQSEVRYRYWGPDDKLTRPFCQRLVESGRNYSRDEIERMSNGQLPNVFLTCGGFRCRHSWLLASFSPKPDPAAAMKLAA